MTRDEVISGIGFGWSFICLLIGAAAVAYAWPEYLAVAILVALSLVVAGLNAYASVQVQRQRYWRGVLGFLSSFALPVGFAYIILLIPVGLAIASGVAARRKPEQHADIKGL
ncbi:MAG: hypothetical protein EDR02_08055 [Actinobacteria bacterium]|nr:MAG: hypothetical protein EDR02_08055 [Actinomycetota bacterium]RIK08544.1 MAG: hypothetical protein DCC48_00950 [Acidobacteriota bacterium]